MSKFSGESVTVEGASTEEDVTRINEFFNSKTIKQELHRFTYRTTLDRAFNRKDRRLFYVEDDEVLAGALMVWCESRVLDDEEAQIRLVAVSPDSRDRGIAATLCRRAEGFATEQDQNRISADVARDSPAVDFWTSIGYEIEYEWETDGGREMYRIMKDL
ncbi:GNAT family N-acetyltransferase [Halorientalis regularis]|uniref:GNAT family N-acetyltransferase n=1 Tax=Halorientalis regularis TaxID=660518 RepID=UPI000B8151FF|nr:GNAT family N-acetyltransferase [Halorientalis regularis]